MFMSRGAGATAIFMCLIFVYLEWELSRVQSWFGAALGAESEPSVQSLPPNDDSASTTDSAIAALSEAGWTVAAILVAGYLSLASKRHRKRQEAGQRKLEKLTAREPDSSEVELDQAEGEAQGPTQPVLAKERGNNFRRNLTETRASKDLIYCLRGCLTEHKYNEGLVAYDQVMHTIGEGNKQVWSMLLYCALEAKVFSRCMEFIQPLMKCGELNCNDFVNVVRHYVNAHDVAGLINVLCAMQQTGFELDHTTRNRALNACVAAGDVQLVEALMEGTKTLRPDLVTFNTLLRFHGNGGQAVRCTELLAEIRAACLKPSDMTYGILIDTCVKNRDVDGALRHFRDLTTHDLKPNVVHYTALMQGLVSARRLEEAECLLDDMEAGDAKPDVITYSTLMKAYSEQGGLTQAINLLKRMQQMGTEPDIVLFNTALNACSTKIMKPSEVLKVFDSIVEIGLKPNTATISSVIKALVGAEGFTEAMAFLRDYPSRFGAEPAPRVFKQLLRACHHFGRNEEADQVAAMMSGECDRDALEGQADARVRRWDSRVKRPSNFCERW